MIYRSLAGVCLVTFYICFFTILAQKRVKQLKDRQDLPKRFLKILFGIVSFATPVIDIVSIAAGKSYLGIMWKVTGLYFAVIGVVFIVSEILVSLKNKRLSQNDTDSGFETKGIYQIGRNPLYTGFDFMCMGMCLMYCNPITIFMTVISLATVHSKILDEERILNKENKEEFDKYRQEKSRYIGFGKPTFKRIVCVLYLCILVWSILYFLTLLCYAGPILSWIWIWILIGGWSCLRYIMIYREIKGTNRIKIPKGLYAVYLAVVCLGLIFFAIVEIRVIGGMNARPKENLDYVIVLGAGLNGTKPSNPLVKRIEEAARYMSDNKDTILIASGGKGAFETISEAECIKRELIRLGVDENRILMEDMSTSTVENLRNSMKIINNPEAKVGIITNGFHEFRAGIIAKGEGYKNYYPVPAETLFPVGVHYIVREFFGIVRLMIS